MPKTSQIESVISLIMNFPTSTHSDMPQRRPFRQDYTSHHTTNNNCGSIRHTYIMYTCSCSSHWVGWRTRGNVAQHHHVRGNKNSSRQRKQEADAFLMAGNNTHQRTHTHVQCLGCLNSTIRLNSLSGVRTITTHKTSLSSATVTTYTVVTQM